MPIILPPRAPDEAGWEEIYGPDFPYSWLDAGQPTDTPVLQNSHCRVRYETTTHPGLTIDAWDDQTSALVEQGKMLVARAGDFGLVWPALVSASILEYTPDRAIMQAVLVAGDDSRSRERLLVTLQRGWTGPRFELYGAPQISGAPPALLLRYSMPPTDDNCSAIKIDAAAAAAIAATAGRGSALFAPAGMGVGAGAFTGENQVAVIREHAGNGKQADFAVLQQAVQCVATSGTLAYADDANIVQFQSDTGYLSVHVGYGYQAASQIIEAENFPNPASTTALVVSGGVVGASRGSVLRDTHGPGGVATMYVPATNLRKGVYRVFVHVLVDAGLTGSFAANLPGSASPVVTSVAPSEWLDLGDLEAVVDSPALAVNGYVSGGVGGGAVSIDRVELFTLEDRTHTPPLYTAARDLGQSVLYDSRVSPRRVARSAV